MNRELVIFIDLSGINGFLALSPTLALIDDLTDQIDISWLPVSGIASRLSNKQPAATDTLAVYKARRFKARQDFERQELRRNCERLGISETQGSSTFDPTYAHLGLLCLNEKRLDPRQYIHKVFDRFFREDRDVQSESVIADLLISQGIPVDEFREFTITGKAALETLEDQLLEQGIFESPGYLLNGERYHGRQHLPLIRWYLTGKNGVAPV